MLVTLSLYIGKCFVLVPIYSKSFYDLSTVRCQILLSFSLFMGLSLSHSLTVCVSVYEPHVPYPGLHNRKESDQQLGGWRSRGGVGSWGGGGAEGGG